MQLKTLVALLFFTSTHIGCSVHSEKASLPTSGDFESSQPAHIYTKISHYEVDVDPAVWSGNIAKICEDGDSGFCAYALTLELEGGLALTAEKIRIGFFASVKDMVPATFPYDVNQIEPATLQKLKDQWSAIQTTCAVSMTIGCGIVSFTNPVVGGVCGMAAAFICSRSPEFFGIEACQFFEPQPGTNRSLKLTPASPGAVASQKCQAYASQTISRSSLSSAQSGCMLSLNVGMQNDVCAVFPSSCFFVQEVQHPAGTEVPVACRRIVR